jgi:peptidoglycan/xylan/chitin deacetylase (PgdA/CDA1 family)
MDLKKILSQALVLMFSLGMIYLFNYTSSSTLVDTYVSATPNIEIRSTPIVTPIEIIDDRPVRQNVRFNYSINKRVVILRLDDVQAFAWNNLTIEIINDVLKRNLSITLGVIPQYLSDDKIMRNYLRNVSRNPHIEIAQHGYDHKDNEYKYLSEEEAYKTTNIGLSEIVNVTGRYPVTFIPPNNIINGSNTTNALSSLGFKIISGDVRFEYDNNIMNMGFSTSTLNDSGSDDSVIEPLQHVEKIIADCLLTIEDTNICVIMMHPQDYSLDNGSADPEKINNYLIPLLDSIANNIKSITFSDLMSPEYKEGDNKMIDIAYATEESPSSWSFGNSDCQRYKISYDLLPTGNSSTDATIKSHMEIIAWDYGLRDHNEMRDYCIKRGFDMDNKTDYYEWYLFNGNDSVDRTVLKKGLVVW